MESGPAETAPAEAETTLEVERHPVATETEAVPSPLLNAEKERQRELRDRRVTAARAFIEANGYTVDQGTEPYKSFDPAYRERFYIQKCRDAQGREVVVKVSLPDDEQQIQSLRNEQQLLSALSELGNQGVPQAGIEVRFLPYVGGLEGANQAGLVTEFAPESRQMREQLSVEARAEVILESIRWMQSIPLPERLTDTSVPRTERTLRIQNADEHLWEARSGTEALVKAEAFSQAEADELLFLLKNSESLIDSFPLVLSHGDLHGGNIRLAAGPDGRPSSTIIDLEAVGIDNGLADIANLSVYSELGARAAAIPEAKGMMAQLEKSWMGPSSEGMRGKIIDEMANRFNDRVGDALKVFRLMKIVRALRSIPRKPLSEQNQLEKMSTKIFSSIVREEMNALRSA